VAWGPSPLIQEIGTGDEIAALITGRCGCSGHSFGVGHAAGWRRTGRGLSAASWLLWSCPSRFRMRFRAAPPGQAVILHGRTAPARWSAEDRSDRY